MVRPTLTRLTAPAPLILRAASSKLDSLAPPATASLVLNLPPAANQWQPGSRMTTFTAAARATGAAAFGALTAATRLCAAAFGCDGAAIAAATTRAEIEQKARSRASGLRMARSPL